MTCKKKFNYYPFSLDIELWQLICNEMKFKSQNYLLSCDRNLWHQLRIYELPGKYGRHITNDIIKTNKRYHYFRHVSFASSCKINSLFCNRNITNEVLQFFTKAISIDLSNCSQITDVGLEYIKNVYAIKLQFCRKITDTGLKNLQNITHITLFACPLITLRGKKILKDINPNVYIFDIDEFYLKAEAMWYAKQNKLMDGKK